MSAQYVEPAPRPAPRAAGPQPRRSVVWYYRAAEVAVTNHYFHQGRDRYPIGELTDLGLSRGPAHPSVLISSVIAVAQAPIVVPVVAVLRSPVAFVWPPSSWWYRCASRSSAPTAGRPAASCSPATAAAT